MRLVLCGSVFSENISYFVKSFNLVKPNWKGQNFQLKGSKSNQGRSFNKQTNSQKTGKVKIMFFLTSLFPFLKVVLKG